jgi:AraC-like DNA-binding protein
MYRERASQVPGAVLWTVSTPTPGAVQRVLPDGCLDLMWVDGELLVAGPDTQAFLGASPSAECYTAGLRFATGTGPTVLGVPGHELRDQRVPLADLWPAAQVRRLTEQVHEATDPGIALEEIAAGRLRQAGPPDPAISEIVERLRANAPVRAVAEAVGLGERQLHRRSLVAFGYGPKTLVRILRMNRALAMARGGAPFATVAAVTGYADQAHLSREVKALAGVPLTELTP